MSKAHEALVFVDISTTTDAKGLRAVHVRATGHEKLTNVMLSVLANWRKITLLVILKRNNLPNEKYPTHITFKYHEKGSMTAELMVKWLRKILDRRSGALCSPSKMKCRF